MPTAVDKGTRLEEIKDFTLKLKTAVRATRNKHGVEGLYEVHQYLVQMERGVSPRIDPSAITAMFLRDLWTSIEAFGTSVERKYICSSLALVVNKMICDIHLEKIPRT